MVNETEFECTACAAKIIDKYDAKLHPLLKVLICKKCFKNYGDGDFAALEGGVDINGDDEYCRWCADGGTLVLCQRQSVDPETGDRCHKAYCQTCIIRNFPEWRALDYTLVDNPWVCFACNPSSLKQLRTQAVSTIKLLNKSSTPKARQNSSPPSPPTTTRSTRSTPQKPPAKIEEKRKVKKVDEAENDSETEPENVSKARAESGSKIKAENSSKARSENGSKTKAESGSKTKDENGLKTKAESGSRTKDENGLKTKAESGSRTKDENGLKTKAESGSKTKDENVSKIEEAEVMEVDYDDEDDDEADEDEDESGTESIPEHHIFEEKISNVKLSSKEVEFQLNIIRRVKDTDLQRLQETFNQLDASCRAASLSSITKDDILKIKFLRTQMDLCIKDLYLMTRKFKPIFDSFI